MGRYRAVTDEDRSAITKAYQKGGLRLSDIARMFDRCEATIRGILFGGMHRPKAPTKDKTFKPPVTGSASGFIRPIDYSRLTAGRSIPRKDSSHG